MMSEEDTMDLHEAVRRGDTDRVTWLLDSGVDINQDWNFLSPLGCAAESKQTEVASILLSRGCDVNLGDRRLKTPLHMASRTGNLTLVKLLLGYRPKLELKHVNGNTPLHEAVARGHTEIAREMIAAGGDVKALNNGKETALHIACLKGYSEITEMLIEAGSDLRATKGKLGVEPIHLAAFGGHIDVLKLLLKAGVNINTAKQDNGRTPLHIAAIHNCVDFVEVLISHGCDLDPVSFENEEDKTPLLKAVELGHVRIVEKLLAAGADTNKCDRWGVTPLLTVMFKGQGHMGKILIQAGSDVNQACRNGVTPFSASLRNTADLTMLLVLANCRLTFTDRERLLSAIEIAHTTEQRAVLSEIHRVISNPRPLTHLCRTSIRTSMVKCYSDKVDTLCLPLELRKFLKYSDL